MRDWLILATNVAVDAIDWLALVFIVVGAIEAFFQGLWIMFGSRDGHHEREFGEAMARNPTPLIIPCYRVLAAAGKIGGFSAPGGSKTKARMLESEGVRIGPPEAVQQSVSF